MNRKIKFRAKAINTNEWIESMTITEGTIKRKKDNLFFEIYENKWVGVIVETFGQFSGELDKNKKEIFEGDLFKIGADNRVFEVKFVHGCFMAFYKNKQFGLIGELQNCFIDVVGNIYENAEVLV